MAERMGWKLVLGKWRMEWNLVGNADMDVPD